MSRHFKKRFFCLQSFLILLLIAGMLSCSDPSEKNKTDQRPNILLLVADDLGYADLGCYGGDIETPNIDNLAANGIRFSRFHTSPLCAPTRAMLLTENDNHIAGIGRQGLQTNEFGYEGRLTNRVITISALLRNAGYHTYMAGKWHLGDSPESNPHQKGFVSIPLSLLKAEVIIMMIKGYLKTIPFLPILKMANLPNGT